MYDSLPAEYTQREEEKKVEAQIDSLLKDEDNFKDPIISISNE